VRKARAQLSMAEEVRSSEDDMAASSARPSMAGVLGACGKDERECESEGGRGCWSGWGVPGAAWRPLRSNRGTAGRAASMEGVNSCMPATLAFLRAPGVCRWG
jgi:hypothetical protein